MIPLDKFLAAVRQNASRVTRYESGGDGSDGGCDCIGLIIGAVKLAGGTWNGVHGSNWAARNEVNDLHKVTKAAQLDLGDIVFKAKLPGDSGYSLPARYKNSGDLLDHYHVGVVTAIDPLCITHCTSVAGGIKRDTALGSWAHAGRLKSVDYEGEVIPLYTAIVSAQNGKSVNLRKSPSANAKVLEQIPCGTNVEVLEETNADWAKVLDHGVTGYMMRKFLNATGDLLALTKDDAKRLYEAVKTITAIFDSVDWGD